MTRVALAAVAGAHGIKGELKLKLFATSVASLAGQPRLYLGGEAARLEAVRAAGKTAIARFAGVADRSAAEALRGRLVEIDQEDLPPLAEDEYYHADVIGLPCVDFAGEPVGSVVAIENFGAGDLLDIELTDGRRSLIPFRDDIARLDGGRIVLDREFLA